MRRSVPAAAALLVLLTAAAPAAAPRAEPTLLTHRVTVAGAAAVAVRGAGPSERVVLAFRQALTDQIVRVTARRRGGVHRATVKLPVEGLWVVAVRGRVAGTLLAVPGGVQSATELRGCIAFPVGHALWTMRADGTGRRRLSARRGEIAFDPSLSPDGTALTFRVSDTRDAVPDPNGIGLDQLVRIGADGTGRRNVNPPTGGLFARWSPDGSRIAYSGVDHSTDTADAIYTMKPDGSAIRRLTPGQGEGPVWSPDGSRIAYGSHGGDGNWQIWIVGADGSTPRRLTDEARPVIPADWGAGGILAWRPLAGGVDRVVVIDPADGSERVVEERHAPTSPILWLPNGKIVVGESGTRGLPHWFWMNADGTGREALPQLYGAGDPFDWAWS